MALVQPYAAYADNRLRLADIVVGAEGWGVRGCNGLGRGC